MAVIKIVPMPGQPGSAGAQGVQGIQGPANGIQGTQGIQGAQGPAGSGSSGSGIQGPAGPQGPEGIQGATGIQGISGSNGAQGLQGIQGLQGAGIPGTQGIQGPQGEIGLQGIQGISGDGQAFNLSIEQISANGIASESYSNISTIQFDEVSGFNVENPANGVAKISLGSSFKYWNLDGAQGLVAEGEDTVNFIPGDHIQISMSVQGNNKNFGIDVSPDVITENKLANFVSKDSVTISSSSAVILDSFSLDSTYAAEYFVQVTSGTTKHIEKVLVLADAATIEYTKYGILTIGDELPGLNIFADMGGPDGVLLIQVPYADINHASVKVFKTAIS